jgi:hypothetical protein
MAYPAIQSELHIGGPQQEENAEKWRPILEKHAAALVEVSSEGKDSAIDRHTSRGQLLGQSNFQVYAKPILRHAQQHEIGYPYCLMPTLHSLRLVHLQVTTSQIRHRVPA